VCVALCGTFSIFIIVEYFRIARVPPLGTMIHELSNMCDVWCVMYDGCMMYDVWCMMYDVWCMIVWLYDVWWMMYDEWCMMNDIWCMMYDDSKCLFVSLSIIACSACVIYVCMYVYVCVYVYMYVWCLCVQSNAKIHRSKRWWYCGSHTYIPVSWLCYAFASALSSVHQQRGRYHSGNVWCVGAWSWWCNGN